MSVHHESPVRQDQSLPRIFGRYLLVDRLSQGGMGELFLARHGMSGFEKLVVIKKVLPHLAADKEFLSRFIDEATVAVHLQHANVAQVYEVGRVEDEYFLALEYVAGNDLRAIQNALVESGRAMPIELALFVAREAASGLAYAHRRTDEHGAPLGVVHCDISPPNIVLSFEGEVKIIDFGIARSARRLTETNPERGFGKFGYLAPEQLLRGGVVDQRTDTYALGVVLYEMLTGHRMFEVGDTPDYKALARMVVKGIHPLPSQINKRLAPYDELVATALKPDPAQRFGTAAEFRDEIQRALVAVNPTINADHLGILVRELFAGTDVDRRRALSEIEKTDLEHWRRELDNQARSTISFALAGGASSHTAEIETHDRFDIGGESAPALPVAEPIRLPTGDLDTDTEADEQRSRPILAPRAGRGRRIAIAVAVLLILAGTASAAVWWAGRSAERSEVASTPAAAVGTQVVVTQLPEEEAVAAVAEEPVASDAAPPPPSRPSKAKKRDRKRHRSKKELTADQVEARFRSARREYQKFKERFGPRLEAEWNELADRATYARTTESVADLDRKIRQFRARMSAESKGPGTDKRPSDAPLDPKIP
jgi:serine/threonine protein kinase